MEKNKEIFRQVIKYFIKSITKFSIQVWQLLIIGGIAIYLDKTVEFIFIFAGFQICRSMLRITYHASTLWLCTLISAISFGLTCMLCPNFHTSLIIQMPLGAFLAFCFTIFEIIRRKYKWFEGDDDE